MYVHVFMYSYKLSYTVSEVKLSCSEIPKAVLSTGTRTEGTCTFCMHRNSRYFLYLYGTSTCMILVQYLYSISVDKCNGNTCTVGLYTVLLVVWKIFVSLSSTIIGTFSRIVGIYSTSTSKVYTCMYTCMVMVIRTVLVQYMAVLSTRTVRVRLTSTYISMR